MAWWRARPRPATVPAAHRHRRSAPAVRSALTDARRPRAAAAPPRHHRRRPLRAAREPAARHAARGPGVRQASFYGGLVLIVGTLTMTGNLSDELFAAHMAEHLVIGDLGGAAARPGADRRRCSRRSCGSGSSTACASSPTRSSRSPCGRSNLYLWHLAGPARGRGPPRGRPRAAAHELRRSSARTCGWRCSARCPSRRGSATSRKLVYIIAVRLTGAMLGNVFVFGGHAFYGVYAAGERAHGISRRSATRTRPARS